MTRRFSCAFWLPVVVVAAFFAFCAGHLIGAANEWHACKVQQRVPTLGIVG